MRVSKEMIRSIIRKGADADNVRSVIDAFNDYGHRPEIALNLPHRAAQFFAQIAHESGGFIYDQEVWGPTAAQKRSDTRTDLGNTPERDGDGKLFKGRTGIQITGRANYCSYRDWLRSIGLNPPDFEKEPHRVNEDPWEGLAPIWYWTTRNLNRYADKGDIEMITRRINGGLNGYADRLNNYDKLALNWLGYQNVKPSIEAFQMDAQSNGWLPEGADQVDGVIGPKTRAALHLALVDRGNAAGGKDIAAAPVSEKVAVAPKGAEKTGLGRLSGFVSLLASPFAAFSDMDTEGKLIVVGVGMIATVILLAKGEVIARRVKTILKALR